MYPATEVHVVLGTDAPLERALHVRVTVREAGRDGGALAGESHAWVRGGRAPDLVLPASFGVVPGPRRSEAVTLTVDAELEAGGATEPALAFRRVARFRFAERATTRVPIFLATSCGLRAEGCTSVPASACTVSVRCEEMGTTCGDDATCVPQDVTPVPPDAALPGARDVVLPRVDAVATDAVAMDAPVVPDVAPGPDATVVDAPADAPALVPVALDPGTTWTSPVFGPVPAAPTTLMSNCSSVPGFDIGGAARVAGLAHYCAPLPGGGMTGTPRRGTTAGALTPLLASDFCASGATVVGVHGQIDATGIARFGVTCANVGARAGGDTSVTMMPARGTATGMAFQATCPARQIVTAVRYQLESGPLRNVGFTCTGVVRR